MRHLKFTKSNFYFAKLYGCLYELGYTDYKLEYPF